MWLFSINMDSIPQLKAELRVSLSHLSTIHSNSKSERKKYFCPKIHPRLKPRVANFEKIFFISDFGFYLIGEWCGTETLNSAFSCEMESVLIEFEPHLSQNYVDSNEFHWDFYLFFRLNHSYGVLGGIDGMAVLVWKSWIQWDATSQNLTRSDFFYFELIFVWLRSQILKKSTLSYFHLFFGLGCLSQVPRVQK